MRHIRFPPKWRLVLVPESPRTATALGITLYTASKPVPLAAQRVLWAAARMFGGRALPGAREEWQPPLPAATFAELRAQISAAIGRDPDGFAVYERPQRERAGGLTMLGLRRAGLAARPGPRRRRGARAGAPGQRGLCRDTRPARSAFRGLPARAISTAGTGSATR